MLNLRIFSYMLAREMPRARGRLGDVPVVIAEGEDDGLRFAVLDDGLGFPSVPADSATACWRSSEGRSVSVI